MNFDYLDFDYLDLDYLDISRAATHIQAGQEKLEEQLDNVNRSPGYIGLYNKANISNTISRHAGATPPAL